MTEIKESLEKKKMIRSFREELAHMAEASPVEGKTIEKRELPLSQSQAHRCVLRQESPCCKGAGFTISSEGPYTRASLCSCVVNCPECQGTAQRVEQGLAKPCRDPSPKRIVDSINDARIPARYADASLESFSNYSGNGRDVIEGFKRWVKDFGTITEKTGAKGLIMSGPVGVGKTYILAALAKAFAVRGFSVKFIDFFQLLSQIRAAYAGGQSEEELLAPLIQTDILMIDELGKGRNNDFELTVLDQLIMGRYNQRKTLIASTNYSFKEKSSHALYNVDLDQEFGKKTGFAQDHFDSLEARVGARIFSRLFEMTIFVELTGDDFRRQK